MMAAEEMRTSLPYKQPRESHVPVMLTEVLHYMCPTDGCTYVDATFGGGGYSRALLEEARCNVLAIDRDPNVRGVAEAMEKAYGERFHFLQGRFGALETLLAGQEGTLHGIVFDLGVSSMQFDTAGRGFSFREDGPLDMRMSGEGLDAAHIVNSYEESQLAEILFRYGEEKKSRQIARAIVRARAEAPINTTLQLRDVIYSVLPPRKGAGGQKIDPATRSFQALRIAVNDELGEIERALEASLRLLAPGGRLVVVSFHSLEDRIVKQFMARCGERKPAPSRHVPVIAPESGPGLLTPLHRGVVKVSESEAERNPRARSAKLRAALRTNV